MLARIASAIALIIFTLPLMAQLEGMKKKGNRLALPPTNREGPDLVLQARKDFEVEINQGPKKSRSGIEGKVPRTQIHTMAAQMGPKESMIAVAAVALVNEKIAESFELFW